MTFKQTHPDFAAIEAHIRNARVERSLVIGQMIANGLAACGRLFAAPEQAEAESRHIAADAFLKRSIQ
jgi:hypothetical protein